MAALAHAYFKRAAQQGHIGAAFELAFQFERGIGTNTDLKRARLLYKVAARQNHLNAQYNLAILLAAGSGGKADFKQAYMWVLAAHSNALKTSHTVLTPQRVSQLAQKIRTRIRYHDALKARRGAIRLTGFDIQLAKQPCCPPSDRYHTVTEGGWQPTTPVTPCISHGGRTNLHVAGRS
jgi:hypothetical protein